MNDLIWIELNKKNLKHNIGVFRKLVGPDTVIAPAVKSHAYGHGLIEVGRIILNAGADWLSVNSIDEAWELRKSGVKKPILVIGYIPFKDLKRVASLNVRPLVYSLKTAEKLNELGKRKKKTIRVHIKLDTGMSRQGIMPDQVVDFIRKIQKMPALELEGLATHFASSDDPESPQVFKRQRDKYIKAVEELSRNNIHIPYLHTANSAAILLYGSALGNLVRPGKSIYGNYPSKDVARICRKNNIILKPILSLKTRVVQIKEVPKGTGISYGSTYITKKRTRLAVLPIGYYDGLDRKLSNTGEVLIKGRRCPIRGRICMNMCMADITRVKNVRVEDEAVIIGRQGSESILVEELAEKAGTINYEIVTRLRESIERKIV